jgi:hypothetical protein
VGRVSLQSIDGTVVFSRLETEPCLDFDCLSLVSLKNIALLSTNEIL